MDDSISEILIDCNQFCHDKKKSESMNKSHPTSFSKISTSCIHPVSNLKKKKEKYSNSACIIYDYVTIIDFNVVVY